MKKMKTAMEMEMERGGDGDKGTYRGRGMKARYSCIITVCILTQRCTVRKKGNAGQAKHFL